jgi:hypothetical protein
MALAGLPAAAAEIAEPQHSVTIAYDEAIWSASRDAKNVTLKCKADSCGGADAECDTFISKANDGVDPDYFFEEFLRKFTPKMVGVLEDNDYGSPEIVDPAESFYEGGRTVGLSSIRYMQNDVQERAWFAEIGEPFGVIVLQCYAAEIRFEASKAQWMRLVNGIAGPKR